jgi:hypothetical protein
MLGSSDEAAKLEAEADRLEAMAAGLRERAAAVREGQEPGSPPAEGVTPAAVRTVTSARIRETGGLSADLDALAEMVADRVMQRLAPPSVQAPMVVDAAEAARLLGINEKALRTRVQRGQLPRAAVVHVGRRLQFRPDKLLRER